jgi:hypothetical protein
VQAFNQSSGLKLFCYSDAITIAFHIVTNNVIFIREDDDLHLGRIDHRRINLLSHMNRILFVFSLSIIFNSNVAKKRMQVICLSISLPKSSM